jgi:hypothetical protein
MGIKTMLMEIKTVGNMKIITSIERGVMVMKNGKAWGKDYEDGHITSWGWIPPDRAPIHDPEWCQDVTDVTWEDSPYIEELKTGKLVEVERRIETKYDEFSSELSKKSIDFSVKP